MAAVPEPMLVLGTTNAGKLRELCELLEPSGLACRSLAGLSGAVDVEETGSSFAENAALKASQQARALDCWVLAEDSGLVVDALAGAPGIHSARFSGTEKAADRDERNNDLLLQKLAGLSGRDRAAHYACHAALADPSGRIVAVSQGICGGLIAECRQGGGGFGYDPLFIVPEYHRTFGELSPSVKRLISHRGRALRAIIPAVVRVLRPPFAALCLAVIAAVAVAAVGTPAAGASADEPGPGSVDRQAVEHLLRRLGSGSQTDRDRAERDLLAMGPAALPWVAAAEAGSTRTGPPDEATVRRRGIQRRLEDLAAARAIEPAAVSLLLEDARVPDVLAAIFARSGCSIPIDPAVLGHPSAPAAAPAATPRRITISFERATFWEAVGDVIGRAGLDIEYGEQADGLRIVNAAGRDPAARSDAPAATVAAGPLRLAVARVEPTGRGAGSGARIVLRVVWEPRLDPLLVRLPMQSVIAEGPSGEAMPAGQRAAVVEGRPVPGRKWIELPLLLTQPVPALDSLGLLRGTVLLWLQGRQHPFEFSVRAATDRPDRPDEDPPTQRSGGAIVSLRRVAVQGDRLLATVAVTYDEPSEALASHHTWLEKKPVVMIAADGATVAPLEQSVETRSERGLTTTAVFRLPAGGWRPGDGREVRLRWVLPVMIHTVPVDFAIRGVPLPRVR